MNLTQRFAYRPNEVADKLGMSRDLVFKLLASGELKSYKVGTARFIPAESIREFQERKLEEQTD